MINNLSPKSMIKSMFLEKKALLECIKKIVVSITNLIIKKNPLATSY